MLIVCKLQICNCKSRWKASSNQRGDNLARNPSALSSFQVICVHAHGNRAPLTWCMFVSLGQTVTHWPLFQVRKRGADALSQGNAQPLSPANSHFREMHPNGSRRENLKQEASENELLCLVFKVWWFRWDADTVIQEIPLPPSFHTCKMLVKMWTCCTVLSILQKKHF